VVENSPFKRVSVAESRCGAISRSQYYPQPSLAAQAWLGGLHEALRRDASGGGCHAGSERPLATVTLIVAINITSHEVLLISHVGVNSKIGERPYNTRLQHLQQCQQAVNKVALCQMFFRPPPPPEMRVKFKKIGLFSTKVDLIFK
jgi:hypothetical protein